LLRFRSPALSVSIRCHSRLTLLLSLRGLQSCFSIGCRLCLTLYLFFEPLLLTFSRFQLRLGIGCGLTHSNSHFRREALAVFS